jgi:ABC-type nitrate/sulfonate/bicarbonate transport system substrate-binding protein
MKYFGHISKILIVLFACVTSYGCSKTNTPITIQSGYVPSASGASIFHIMESNCLENIKFESQKYKSSDLLASDLARNQIQVALVCGIAEILTQIEKQPGKIVILGIYESTPCFLVPKGSDEKYIESLNSGKKHVIGCWPGATFPFYTRSVLDSIGLNSKNLYLTPVPPDLQISQLQKREIDALYTLEPIGVKAVVDGIAEYRYTDINLLAHYIIEGDYFPGGCLAMSKEYFDKNPEIVKNLLECLENEKNNITPSNPITIQALAKYTSLLTHYTPSLKIKPIILNNKMVGKEMQYLVNSLISMNKLDSSINWKNSFWIGE